MIVAEDNKFKFIFHCNGDKLRESTSSSLIFKNWKITEAPRVDPRDVQSFRYRDGWKEIWSWLDERSADFTFDYIILTNGAVYYYAVMLVLANEEMAILFRLRWY